MEVKCSNCGKIIDKDKYRIEHYKNLFCDKKCKAEWQSRIPPELHPHYKHGLSSGSKFVCVNCKKNGVRKHFKQKYCSVSCQMNYEYKTGTRDKFKITKKANDAVRKNGQPKLKGKPTAMKGKTKANGLYNKSWGFQKGNENIVNKYPEKHPNYILAQKGHRTMPEKIMEKLLIEKNIEYIYNQRIGKYWVDFLLIKNNLILEVDGHHWHQKDNPERDNYLKSRGYDILHWRVTKYSKLQLENSAKEFIKKIK